MSTTEATKNPKEQFDRTPPAGKEMDTEVVWQIESKAGKPVKLYLKNKEQQFEHEITQPGRYSMALHTPDRLPGGAIRKVECLVSVYKNLGKAPQLTAAEELREYALGSESQQNVVLRDLYEVHSKQSTTVAEFELKDSDLPASVHIIAKTHTPLIGMRFTGKLFRNTNLHDLGDRGGKDFGVEDQWMFQTLTIESIRHELSRDSEYKQRAFDAGMIRPFLFLVSMHPIMRVQIGDLMGIKLIDLDGKQKWSHDPHAQADRILLKHLKGLGSIADHMYETINPISKKSNWYDCLYRGSTEVHPEDHGKMDTKITGGTDKLCKDVHSDEVRQLELQFLESAQHMHKKEIEKLEKDSGALTHRVDEYMKDPEVVKMLHQLEKNGITNADARRFLVEVCVANDYQSWSFYHELEMKEAGKNPKKEEPEDLARQWAQETSTSDSTGDANIKKDNTYDAQHAVLGGLHAQLMQGNYDPRGLSETGKAAAKKAGQFVAQKAFKHFVLTPLFPFLLLPYDVANLVDKVLGSDHQTVWLVSLQITLQRMMLAAHDITVDDYERPLSEKWLSEQK